MHLAGRVDVLDCVHLSCFGATCKFELCFELLDSAGQLGDFLELRVVCFDFLHTLINLDQLRELLTADRNELWGAHVMVFTNLDVN